MWSFGTGLALRWDDHLHLEQPLRGIVLMLLQIFVSWDLGLGYRPLQWLGFGASGYLGKFSWGNDRGYSLSSGISYLILASNSLSTIFQIRQLSQKKWGIFVIQ